MGAGAAVAWAWVRGWTVLGAPGPRAGQSLQALSRTPRPHTDLGLLQEAAHRDPWYQEGLAPWEPQPRGAFAPGSEPTDSGQHSSPGLWRGPLGGALRAWLQRPPLAQPCWGQTARLRRAVVSCIKCQFISRAGRGRRVAVGSARACPRFPGGLASWLRRLPDPPSEPAPDNQSGEWHVPAVNHSGWPRWAGTRWPGWSQGDLGRVLPLRGAQGWWGPQVTVLALSLLTAASGLSRSPCSPLPPRPASVPGGPVSWCTCPLPSWCLWGAPVPSLCLCLPALSGWLRPVPPGVQRLQPCSYLTWANGPPAQQGQCAKGILGPCQVGVGAGPLHPEGLPCAGQASVLPTGLCQGSVRAPGPRGGLGRVHSPRPGQRPSDQWPGTS